MKFVEFNINWGSQSICVQTNAKNLTKKESHLTEKLFFIKKIPLQMASVAIAPISALKPNIVARYLLLRFGTNVGELRQKLLWNCVKHLICGQLFIWNRVGARVGAHIVGAHYTRNRVYARILFVQRFIFSQQTEADNANYALSQCMENVHGKMQHIVGQNKKW